MLVNKYLKSNFLQSFISIFITLFIIVSVTMLIQISRVLDSVDASFFDVLKLYLYASVKLLLITMPLSFFIAICMCVNRLCKDNELIVLFTLGLKSKEYAKYFVKISFVVSVFLSVLAFVFIPITLKLQENFIDYKKLVSKISIKPSSFGQEFGSWLVFVEEKDKEDEVYHNIIMFEPKLDKKTLIIAKRATITNTGSQIVLKLDNGTLYEFGKKTYIAEFKTLNIFTQITSKIGFSKDIFEYWSDFKGKRSKELVIYMLLALFPLASVFFATSIGLIISRYEKNLIYLKIFLVIVPYFSVISLFYKYHLITIFVTVFLYLFLGLIYFKKKVSKRF